MTDLGLTEPYAVLDEPDADRTLKLPGELLSDLEDDGYVVLHTESGEFIKIRLV